MVLTSPSCMMAYRMSLTITMIGSERGSEKNPSVDPMATGLTYNDYRGRTYVLPEYYHPTAWVGRTAVDFIQSYNRSQPFLLKFEFKFPFIVHTVLMTHLVGGWIILNQRTCLLHMLDQIGMKGMYVVHICTHKL